MKSKFVLAQLDQKGWPEENLANAEKAVAEAVERYQPDMMIFPECFMSHFPTGTDSLPGNCADAGWSLCNRHEKACRG